MKTEILRHDPVRAAEVIRAGGLVAVPTETVYGLAGNGLNPEAVKEIYEVKGRPAIKPLSLMVPGPEAMEMYCQEIPEAAYALARHFWPGPLTIILKSKECVPDIVRAGNPTVGLRCPDHDDTLALLKTCGLPLAAPSANPSSAPSPKSAGAVMDYFDGKIDAVIDGGECTLGRESTILDMAHTPYRILRQGALPEETIRRTFYKTVKVIGITGGTGCGKTTALNVLKRMDFAIIDADEVYHNLLQTCEPMLAELRESFPSAFDNGILNRKTLGTIVFHDDELLTKLNAITHKYVDAEIDRIITSHALNGGKYAAIDAIALFESGQAEKCFANIGVVADAEIRIRRIMARDNIPYEYAASRVEAQHPNSYFENLCTCTVSNNGTPEEFELKCEKLFKELIKDG